MEEKRLDFIDVAKGVGIMLVVIGHLIDHHNNPLGIFIYSFHMPLFFILSGLCFNETRYKTFLPFLSKRTRTLLLPFLYFVSFLVLAEWALGINHYSTWISTGKTPGASWFVLVLFLSEVLYFLIFKVASASFHKPKVGMLAICCALIIVAFIFSKYQILNTFALGSIPICTLFYAMGHQTKPILRKMMDKCSIVWAVLFMAAPFALALLTNDNIELHDNYLPTPLLLRIVGAYLSSFGFIVLCSHICQRAKSVSRVLQSIGRNTLVILLLHWLFIYISMDYIKPLIDSFVLYKVIELTFICAMCFISVKFINRYVPWIIGK